MTAIHQSLVTAHQSQNRTEGESSQSAVQAINSSTGEPGSSTVNISWQAVMRLSAFEQQLQKRGSVPDDNHPLTEPARSKIIFPDNNPVDNHEEASLLPDNIKGMLSEIEQHLVETSEPGYRHLRNLLNNQRDVLSEPEQLHEVVRKERFFLGRRKAFMDSADFQSYSQVLNQFSNIIQREFTA